MPRSTSDGSPVTDSSSSVARTEARVPTRSGEGPTNASPGDIDDSGDWVANTSLISANGALAGVIPSRDRSPLANPFARELPLT